MMDVLIGWPGGGWQASARLFSALFGAYLLVLWLASILWAYRDIRARSDDPVSHLIGVTIATIFPIVGLPVYLILRPAETLTAAYERQLEQDTLLTELHAVNACPNCRHPVDDDFVVCAFCSTALKQPCAHCGRPLQRLWRHCPYCATPRPQARPYEERAQGDEAPATSMRPSAREAALEAVRRATSRASAEVAPEEAARRPRAAEEPAPGVVPPRPRVRPRITPDDPDR